LRRGMRFLMTANAAGGKMKIETTAATEAQFRRDISRLLIRHQ
jgi:hypothetical protein